MRFLGIFVFNEISVREVEIIAQLTKIRQIVKYYYLHNAPRQLVILVPTVFDLGEDIAFSLISPRELSLLHAN